MNFENYADPALLMILTPILNIIGKWYKDKTKFENKYIPIVLFVVSLIAAGVFYAANYNGDILSTVGKIVLQGFVCAATAVYGNQLLKQLKSEDEENDA